MKRYSVAGALAALVLAGTAQAQAPTPEAIRAATAGVDGEAIAANAHGGTENWLNYGLGYEEQRFSKLTGVTDANVGELGLAWSHDMQSRRGVEATPIVVDGIMYVTASWSVVHALDAVTGEELWVYDPQVDPAIGYKGCCDVVNRGVAIWKGKVFVGAYDGVLHAIDAATGEGLWKVDTVWNHDFAYTITGAPRVVNGRVIIGNGGAEYGARGYVTAYDAETGEEAWRWFTVPGDPEKPYENAAMEKAAETWDPSAEYWKMGGGGTVWDAMAFDPELNLLYIGVGNGAPWNRDVRSPKGGDNLFLASIVALDATTGEYRWHYQNTPGDTWDYTSTQHIMLADIAWEGATRKVLMQAPKNGFFFVIDRETGEYLSAEPFAYTSWASHYDENGRPVELVGARPGPGQAVEVTPSAYGAHNWHPMSYSPETGLVYIPAQGVPLTLMPDTERKFNEASPNSYGAGGGWNLGYYLNAVAPNGQARGMLIAWDPEKQQEAWRKEYLYPWNGGTLATAGNLVFQGTSDGRFVAYDAKTGDELWSTTLGVGVIAAPMTWSKDGVQYVTIAAGWGGAYGVQGRHTDKIGPGTVFTFKLGGDAPMPEFAVPERELTLLRGVAYDSADMAEGQGLYVAMCATCHGTPGLGKSGNVPNLGYADPGLIENLPDLVLGGAMIQGGMPNFEDKLDEAQITKIAAFIQGIVEVLHPE
ncbi:PQQ-dependent dehydrogenase, methanol/ethanol family [Albimonas sp. CAU 1670]|uniref:PQQ-dependent dehydrogenase, methanol/ethanol family n=1 Tax=Albimonas sp. CAU 1670 TaxID=3032599 RepID=UPI0023DA62AD|nr:PQQ-dependent dehydrogenase, methanol/ethanol family [Albimonas sp. CAU 1670]MDF2231481.1 PQQ-dependent dehydrogenase, methanol/ethanol family [Albimonas sp. CAU 1670]